jgi:hypothetical protein
MAQQIINNGESGLIVRGKLNDNFAELYDANLENIIPPTSALGNYVLEQYHDGAGIDSTEWKKQPFTIIDEGAGVFRIQQQAGTGKVRIGSASPSADYTEFETDGTMRMVGNATVFKDIVIPIVDRSAGSNRPSLSPFIGNIQAYSFAVNDIVYCDFIELPHDWKEGSEIEFHLHWATSKSYSVEEKLQWELFFTTANMGEVFPSQTTLTKEVVIPIGTASLQHFYTSMGTFDTTGLKIGAVMGLTVRRIAKTAGGVESAAPYLLDVGIHYEADTIGSRLRASK